MARGILLAESGWLLAWLTIPLAFAAFSRPSLDDPSRDPTEVIVQYVLTLCGIALPPLLIFLLATPFTVVLAFRVPRRAS